MDAYTFVLEGLRENNFRRLRAFESQGRGSLSTWLVVVARRLCHEYHRAKYGRTRAGEEKSPALEARARLVDLLGAEVEPDELPGNATNPELEVRRGQLRSALEGGLKQLSAEERLLLTWRFEEDLPVKEIARLTDASVFQVYRRLNSVFRKLRKELQMRGIEGAAP
jgi:RNA polymerase sigma factor (sigma-70 family)